MKRRVVNVSVPHEIYANFLPSGTVIDRPGQPLLKIIDAKEDGEGKATVSVEVSPTTQTKRRGKG